MALLHSSLAASNIKKEKPGLHSLLMLELIAIA